MLGLGCHFALNRSRPHYVRQRFAPTLLFIVSGQAPVPQEALPQRATFLPKPFDLHRVLRQIEQSPVTP